MPLNTGLAGDEMSRKRLRVGSRKSALALVQTEWVIDQLKQHHPELEFEVVKVSTTGDNILDKPLAKIGEKALFTRELEDQLLDGRIDLIVHSLKDLPTTLPDRCCIGAITQREDPSDALVLRTGLNLPQGSQQLAAILADGSHIKTFGTSSLRRIAQLRSLSSGIAVKDVRGNINTRLQKLDNHQDHGFDCLVMATSGLLRGGFKERISHRLDWYHAVSQGALGVECRTEDSFVIGKVLAPLVDHKAMLECTAERVLMKRLEGGCSVPIGVRTRWHGDYRLTLEAIVLSLDGSQRVEASATQQLDLPIVDADQFSLPDFTDVSTSHLGEESFKVQLRNSVLLGRTLANRMIDMGVKDILATISRENVNH